MLVQLYSIFVLVNVCLDGRSQIVVSHFRVINSQGISNQFKFSSTNLRVGCRGSGGGCSYFFNPLKFFFRFNFSPFVFCSCPTKRSCKLWDFLCSKNYYSNNY